MSRAFCSWLSSSRPWSPKARLGPQRNPVLSSRIVRDPRTQGGAGNLSIGVNPTRVGAQRTPTNPSPAERAEPAEAAGAAGSCPVSYTSPAQCPLLQPPLSPGFCLRVDVREASPGWSLLPGVPGSITAKGRRQPVDVSVSHRCFSLPSFPSALSKNQWKEDPGVRSRSSQTHKAAVCRPG